MTKLLFGASSVADVMGIGQWACPRKAYYRSSGFDQDRETPFGVMAQGNDLEPLIRNRLLDLEEFSDYKIVSDWWHKKGKYGWLAQSDDHPFLKCHLDDVMMRSNKELDKSNAVLNEYKCVGKWTWDKYVIKGDIPEAYLVQCQSGMAAGGYNPSVLTMMYADRDDFWGVTYHVWIDRSEKIIKAIDRATEAAQSWIDNPPERIQNDKICRTCGYKERCLGDKAQSLAAFDDAPEPEFDDSLADFVKQYEQCKYQKKTIETDIKKIKNKSLELMGDRPIIQTSEGNMTQKIITAYRLDGRQLKIDHPQIWSRYQIESRYNKFMTTENKGA